MARIFRSFKCLLLVLFVTVISFHLEGYAQARQQYLLNQHWKFIQGDPPGANDRYFADKHWETVAIPHDWAIKGPFDLDTTTKKMKLANGGFTYGRTAGLPFSGIGWYRNKLPAAWFRKGQRAVLLFDGAMSFPSVFVNGKAAGHWAYGYTSFSIDITSFLEAGKENTVALKLMNIPESSRWYTGAGLYRNVHLIITDEVHIPVWGTYITSPEVHPEFAKVAIDTKVDIGKTDTAEISLVTDIKDAAGKTVSSAKVMMQVSDRLGFKQQLTVKTPALWSPEMPNLYTAVSRLYVGETLKDQYETTFGIRSIKFDRVKGFSLNGISRKFKGVCNHHDLGPLGAAVNVAGLRRQLTILKDLGCDAIRSSHNMPAPELVRLCNEMGFMLMVESFDEWKTPKVKNGYSMLFDDWAEKDMVNMIQRDRNAPSVVLWSIGNEIPDQSVANGSKLLTFLQDICHREDPSRPVTLAMDRIKDVLANNFAAAADIPGFNYKPQHYQKAHEVLPQGFMLGTETASTVSSRGVYKFPVQVRKDTLYADHQNSSYDLESFTWSTLADEEFVKQDDLDYVLGEFVWTAFDYIGEPTPYDPKLAAVSSYFGILDLAGLPKDRYYLYRSRWNKDKPTLHVLPHWTFPGREGLVTPVFCYTSYPAAELFLNGKSLGMQKKSQASTMNRYRLMWKDVQYQPGTIKIVAYDEQGKAVAEKSIRTAGKAEQLVVEADRRVINADGDDLSYLTVKVLDKEGNLCPEANPQLHFEVSGAGQFVAAANGDATSTQLFHLSRMTAFKGMLVAIVKSTDQAGTINFKVTSKGLSAGKITIQTKN